MYWIPGIEIPKIAKGNQNLLGENQAGFFVLGA
jgi:hypothetical protein